MCSASPARPQLTNAQVTRLKSIKGADFTDGERGTLGGGARGCRLHPRRMACTLVSRSTVPGAQVVLCLPADGALTLERHSALHPIAVLVRKDVQAALCKIAGAAGPGQGRLAVPCVLAA